MLANNESTMNTHTSLSRHLSLLPLLIQLLQVFTRMDYLRKSYDQIKSCVSFSLQKTKDTGKSRKGLYEMHDPRYTTTTTVVETREYIADDGPSVRVGLPSFDFSYIRTLGGMMKCICIALCLLCFLCVLIGGPGYYTGAGWATFVSTVGLSVSTTLLFLYIFRVVDALPQVSWIVGEMCFYFAWTIFFFIAACVLAVAASRFSGAAGWGAAAFFAFGAMCAYGFDCYLKFLSWKNNEVATGGGADFFEEQRRRAQNV